MPDIYLRLILFAGLIFIALFWAVTTPAKTKDYALNLIKNRNLVLLFFQILPLIQLLNDLNLSLP